MMMPHGPLLLDTASLATDLRINHNGYYDRSLEMTAGLYN